ncbi:ubiquitin-conjugating enzyme e2 o, partial [Plakobranchus ocellatus]
KFESGQEVMLDSWLGRVENVVMDAVLVFSDGAKCQIDQNEMFSFDEKVERHGKFSECLYYPGQELKGPLASLAEAKWLHTTVRHSHKTVSKKGKTPTVHVTIEKILTRQVEVLWVFRGYEKIDTPDVSVSPPSRMVEGPDIDRLKVLDWFNHCSVQIGDRMFYRVKNDDILSAMPPSKAYDAKTAREKGCPIKVGKGGQNHSSTDTLSTSLSSQSVTNDTGEDDDADYVDICDDEEEDSDLEEKLGACGGRNVGNRGGGANKKKYTFYKGGGGTQRHKHGHQLKTAGKRSCLKERIVKADDVVEVEIEFNTSWAVVMWQDGTVEKDIPSVDLFPVHHLDELEFFPGDYVLPSVEIPYDVDYGVLVKADHRERTCLIHWFKAYDVGKASEPTVVERNVEMSVYDIKDHPDYKFRPGQSVVRVGGFENLPTDSGPASQAVGQIFELDPNGHLIIKWANGSISQCFPQEVFIVSDEADESDIGSWETESDYDSEASGDSWETESELEITGEDGAKDNAEGLDSSELQGESGCEQKQELNTLLSRAEAALSRLQKLLNNFDVTESAPECFTDIIRIYRSCHDLDKILQSSFFNDSELQALISQAKLELSRDRVNRISKNLTQVFEHWSRNLPAEAAGAMAREGSNIGTVSVGGKTIKIGAVKNGKIVDINVQVPVENKGGKAAWNQPVSVNLENNPGEIEGKGLLESGEQQRVSQGKISSASPLESVSCSECSDVKALKKEFSEPSISKICKGCETKERRPSDPLNDYSAALANRSNEANLVGENCVSKAAKRTNSDGFDDSGCEIKKSRDEGKTSNLLAQELCFKICQNLQKQVVKIQEEVNKRARRLLSASSNPSEKCSNVVQSSKTQVNGNDDSLAIKTSHAHSQMGDNQATLTGVKPLNPAPDASELHKSSAERVEYHRETVDSVPNSIDEGGERANLLGGGLPKAQACDEGGDVPNHTAAAARTDPGNEASCEESSSQPSLASEDVQADLAPCKGFEICGEAVSFHKYVSQESQPVKPAAFKNCIRKELKLFHSSLPDGIFVKGFENRLDLYSVMILGPEGTPYEDALFLFDIMMPNDYPTSPPLLHYYSFCSDRLNPNLYEDGKVCVSLLGTWSGKGSEVWTSKSNLLQVLLSIQGLILVPEPYYNEAYYERQRGTQVGHENSRMYNEMAILKTVQCLTRICQHLPELFKHEIYQYLKSHGPRMIRRLRQWMNFNEQQRISAQGNHFTSSDSCKRPVVNPSNCLPESHTKHTPNHGVLKEQEQKLPLSDFKRKAHGCELDLMHKDRTSHNEETGNAEGVLTDICNFEGKYSHPKSYSSSVDAGFTQAEQDPQVMIENNVDPKPWQSVNVQTSPNHGLLPCSGIINDQKIGTCVDTVLSPTSVLPPAQKGNFDLSSPESSSAHSAKEPDFPLFPMSRGFCLTLQKHLQSYEQALEHMIDFAVTSALLKSDNANEKEIPVSDQDSSQESSTLS